MQTGGLAVDTGIDTKGDVALNAINVGYQTNSIGDANNYFKEGESTDVGSYDPSKDRGGYTSPDGVSFGGRAIPYNESDYIEVKFEVLKPFDTNRSNASEWFDNPGTGKQDKITQELVDPLTGDRLESNIVNLQRLGYINEIK